MYKDEKGNTIFTWEDMHQPWKLVINNENKETENKETKEKVQA